MLKGKTIILGVCGGIAAYKSCEIASRLKELNADVFVVMTGSAREFVSPLTFRTISGNPVITNLFDQELSSQPVPHISLSRRADLIIVAPATANVLGKIAHGMADDALSTIVMSSECRKFIAPAMNSSMWQNPIVRKNVSKLKETGYYFIGPDEGRLACGEEGIGRMSSPQTIIEKILSFAPAKKKQDLKDKTILVTAGGTKEAIDPVRFIGNHSSGKMGYAIAKAAAERGAAVILIAGASLIDPPENVAVIKTTSSEEMFKEVMKHKDLADAIIMAAAVADYKPKITFFQKISKEKDELVIELKKTKDILFELGRTKNGTFLVGFALESENVLENAKEKLASKNLDMIVANDVTSFDSDYSDAAIIDRLGNIENLARFLKTDLAHRILDRIPVNVR